MGKDKITENDNKSISKITVSYDDKTENIIKKGVIISLDEKSVGIESCNINRKQELAAVVEAMLQVGCKYGILDDLID